MSIEQQLSDLTAAIKALTVTLSERQQAAPVAVVAPKKAAEPLGPVTPLPDLPKFTPAPVAVAAPAPVPPPAPAMPAPPTFESTAPAAAAAPFSDVRGLTEYTTKKYQALGAERGQKILAVMQSLGATALTDIKPEQYLAFFNGVEAL